MTQKTTARTDGSPRPLLDDMFMEIAEVVATRSTCPDGARNGAVLVRDGHVVSMGYGSPAMGVPPCDECWLRMEKRRTGLKDWSVCPSVHAELNAILMAAKFGIAVAGAVAYLTKEPCDDCRRVLVNAGVQAFKVKGKDGKIREQNTHSLFHLGSSMEQGRWART